MDNLFYFKLIILTILFKIISKHLQITEQYDELNQTDECIKPNKTEIELKTLNDRKLYKSDKDFELAIRDECLNKNQCYNSDLNSNVRCYFKDEPFRTKNEKLDRIMDDVYKEDEYIKSISCEKIGDRNLRVESVRIRDNSGTLFLRKNR